MPKAQQSTTGLPALDYTPLLRGFLHHDLVGPGLLLSAALAALITVNFGGADWYHDFWHYDLTIALRGSGVTQTLHEWVNDGLMAIGILSGSSGCGLCPTGSCRTVASGLSVCIASDLSGTDVICDHCIVHLL